MGKIVAGAFTDSVALREKILNNSEFISKVDSAAERIVDILNRGGTIYTCGNGGSACDAMHFAEELVARYKGERKGYRAVHFGDPGTITCWSNDYDFDSIYRRSVETFCTGKDLLLVFSTSGNSPNILEAVEAAKKTGCFTLALTGKDGGKVAGMADLSIVVPSASTERIQEVHITLVHIFCEHLENPG